MLRITFGSARGTPNFKAAAAILAVATVAVVVLGPTSTVDAQVAGKWGGAIDPDALQVLKGMTNYLGSLDQFTMHTENTYEDVLETGQKFQFAFSSDVTVRRPDKLVVERTDGIVDHLFVYDGKTLSMHFVEEGFFAVLAVPDNLDDFLHFSRDSLDLVPPAGDMLFTNSFELLTTNVTSAVVVGQAVVGGILCNHIAFTTPLVNWQMWVAEGEMPLPYKYVLTTMDDPAQPQFITWMSDWVIAEELEDGMFIFEAPESAVEIDFVAIGPVGQ